jgi:hypothetical protein
MADLDIDLDRLRRLLSITTTVCNEFDGAEEFSREVASYVGHPTLEGVVHDFASSWNIHRAEISKELQRIHDSTRAIRDTMIELDRAMAAKIEEALLAQNP